MARAATSGSSPCARSRPRTLVFDDPRRARVASSTGQCNSSIVAVLRALPVMDASWHRVDSVADGVQIRLCGCPAPRWPSSRGSRWRPCGPMWTGAPCAPCSSTAVAASTFFWKMSISGLPSGRGRGAMRMRSRRSRRRHSDPPKGALPTRAAGLRRCSRTSRPAYDGAPSREFAGVAALVCHAIRGPSASTPP